MRPERRRWTKLLSQMQIRDFDAAQQPQVKTLGCVLAKQGYKSVEVQPNLGGKSSPLEVWFAGELEFAALLHRRSRPITSPSPG